MINIIVIKKNIFSIFYWKLNIWFFIFYIIKNLQMSKELKKINTKPTEKVENMKKNVKKMLKKISELQHKMFAEWEKSMLIVLQWLDASGKDWVIKKVFSQLNPMWCMVKGFWVPTKEELSHDFLRRIHKETPSKWTIKIFNRSHYEDLVMPIMSDSMDDKSYKNRVEQIKDFEKLLTKNGTEIIKIYLHISPEVQKSRLEERLVDETKHRKHKDGDWTKAGNFKKYIEVYDKVINDTDFDFAPRHILPCDDNKYKIYKITSIVLDKLESLKMKWPKLDTDMAIIRDISEKWKKKDKRQQENWGKKR